MNFVTRLFAAALFAGIATGLITGFLQALTINPLLIVAETYESGALVLGESTHGTDHTHTDWDRIVANLVVNILFGFGGGLVLAGVMVLTGRSGLQTGFLVGIAAFVTFALAPALGLPPRPPAYPEAELISRQIWWLGTAAATTTGIVFLFNSRRWSAIIIATLLFAAPHIIGAPVVEETSLILPPDLVRQFTLWSLVNTGLFWILLGCLTGYFISRSAHSGDRDFVINK